MTEAQFGGCIRNAKAIVGHAPKSQMLNAISSTIPIPITNSASATESYSSQCLCMMGLIL
jgi:hypothetical protein